MSNVEFFKNKIAKLNLSVSVSKVNYDLTNY